MSCHIDFAFLHETVSTKYVYTSGHIPATNHVDSDTSQGSEHGSLVLADIIVWDTAQQAHVVVEQ